MLFSTVQPLQNLPSNQVNIGLILQSLCAFLCSITHVFLSDELLDVG